MTPHDEIEPETDRALDELLDAASEEAESDVSPRPSFAAVLGRARRLDPSLAAPQPPRHARPTRASDDASVTAALAPFVEAARAEAEHDVAAQQHLLAPGLPRSGGSRLVRWVVVGGALAAAAAIVLLLGLLDVQDALRAEQQRQDNQALDQAERERRLLEAETGGDDSEPLARASRRRTGLVPQPKPPEPAFVVPDEEVPLETLTRPEELVEPETELTPEPAPEPAPETVEPTPTRPTTEAARRDRRRQALRRLDERAQQRLSAGDSAGAERAYRALVRTGGRTGLAELAYGDLFTLAHGRGDTRAQRDLWREYLRKFPRGRFADDARAGLCRSAVTGERTRCWEQYLDDFPTGAYHRQAARALSRDQGPASGDPDP